MTGLSDDDLRMQPIRKFLEQHEFGARFYALIIEDPDGSLRFIMTGNDQRFIRCTRKLKRWIDAWFAGPDEREALEKVAEAYERRTRSGQTSC